MNHPTGHNGPCSGHASCADGALAEARADIHNTHGTRPDADSGGPFRMVLLGKNGQLGMELQRALSILGTVCAVDSVDCDVTDAAAVGHLMQQQRPHVIVNASAWTHVDGAEREPERTHAVNAHAPAVLARQAQQHHALLVHYSTDYVFDGSLGRAYTEADTPRPLNVYGASKLAGEQAVRSLWPRHLVLRTSWLAGSHGHNFIRAILRQSMQGHALRVVADQYGSPTSAALLADVTAQLVRQALHAPDGFPYGLYHVAASGKTSWHAYACHILQYARSQGVALQTQEVVPVCHADYAAAAQRPPASWLDTGLLSRTFGLYMPPWQLALQPVLQHICASLRGQ